MSPKPVQSKDFELLGFEWEPSGLVVERQSILLAKSRPETIQLLDETPFPPPARRGRETNRALSSLVNRQRRQERPGCEDHLHRL